MSPRLAIVVSHPIQYYAPWFKHLAREAWLVTRVFYLSDHGVQVRRDEQFGSVFAWDTDLLTGYDFTFVANLARQPSVTRFSGLNNPDLKNALNTFHPDAILLFGYAYRTNLRLIARSPAPIIFRGDSHLLGGIPAQGLKRLILKLIYRRCAAFLPVGKANSDYFAHHGVPSRLLFTAPHCVDADHFQTSQIDRARADSTRAELGIPSDAPVVLFSGKLLPKKRPDLLLTSFLRANVPGAHLIIAGEGELDHSLRTAANGHNHIHFLPFANQSAMPARYLLGDVFVLPSEGRHETWGLAVNEAMHMGLPCIVSDQVGCQVDLVPTGSDGVGVTGWSFPAGDEAALAARLRSALLPGRAALSILGERAREHVAKFSYAAASSGLHQALNHVLNTR